MAKNEAAKRETFSVALTNELKANHGALPKNFNIDRFVQNSVALLNGNETLTKFAQQYGTAQIKAGLLRGAYQGLDAMNQEMYLVPYGSTLNYMPSYKGMQKMAKQYSTRPIRDLYAKLVRAGDSFEEVIEHGVPSINFKAKPFNNAEIVGVFAVVLFEDGGLLYETMSKEDVEDCRKSSKAKNSPAWTTYWGEMAKKTVIRRLCKNLTIDMDADAKELFEAGTEIETNVVEVSKREIEENANTVEFIPEDEPEVIEEPPVVKQKPEPKPKRKAKQNAAPVPAFVAEADQEEMDFV